MQGELPMLSFAKRAALCGNPGLNSPGAHPNEAWWASQVCCAKAEVVASDAKPSPSEAYYAFDLGDAGVKRVRLSMQRLKEPPYGLLGKDVQRVITAYTEVRQPYWQKQPESWITYHAFTILEIDGGALFLLLERKTDMLEIVVGQHGIPCVLMKAFRAVGGGRNLKLCTEQPRQELKRRTTVYQLLEWIDGSLEEGWMHYDLLKANCQHFVRDVQEFLVRPYDSGVLQPFQMVPASDRRDRELMRDAVEKDWHALKYATEELRRDRAVVLDALKVDGRALRYAHSSLRLDREVVLAAVRQDGAALPYAEGYLRQDRDVVMAAVESRGHMLCYAAEEHRRDKKIVLAAVRQDAYAIRYAFGDLKWDPEVLLTATLQNPVAVGRLPFF